MKAYLEDGLIDSLWDKTIEIHWSTQQLQIWLSFISSKRYNQDQTTDQRVDTVYKGKGLHWSNWPVHVSVQEESRNGSLEEYESLLRPADTPIWISCPVAYCRVIPYD